MDTTFYLGYVSFTNSGLLLFERYVSKLTMDSNLLTGMLSALQALSKEISDEKLDEFEFHKFQIYIISSKKYPISHAIITNGAYSKHHAYDLLTTISEEFETELHEDLSRQPITQITINEHISTNIVDKIENGNQYLMKLNSVRSEFFDDNDDGQDKIKKDKVRNEFF